MIHYLKHHEIDFEKWDATVSVSVNGRIYAFSWYLNTVTPGWEALVEDDYISIMPLPVAKKYFLKMLVKPYFNQQLGVFSKQKISSEKVKNFIQQIPIKFFFYRFNLNSENPVELLKKYRSYINYELTLSDSYLNLKKSFSENTRRNIVKAEKNQLNLKTLLPNEYLEGFKSANPNLAENVISILSTLINETLQRGFGVCSGVFNTENKCIAGVFWVTALHRKIYLASFSNTEGKEKSATFLLVSEVIKDNENSGLILDFEGSNIPGVARFFAGFGAEKKIYPHVYKTLI